jgi:hypothetical protein
MCSTKCRRGLLSQRRALCRGWRPRAACGDEAGLPDGAWRRKRLRRGEGPEMHRSTNGRQALAGVQVQQPHRAAWATRLTRSGKLGGAPRIVARARRRASRPRRYGSVLSRRWERTQRGGERKNWEVRVFFPGTFDHTGPGYDFPFLFIFFSFSSICFPLISAFLHASSTVNVPLPSSLH